MTTLGLKLFLLNVNLTDMTDINFGTVFICMTSTYSHWTPSSFMFVSIADSDCKNGMIATILHYTV